MECPRPRLLPCNHDAVDAYMACRTQWNYAGMGVRVGLSYTGVAAALAALHPHAAPGRRRRLFQGISTIEHALLTAQREAYEAAHDKGPADE